MPEENVQAIVLAAGSSKRFNTEKSKLLHTICGQEMIRYTTKLLAHLHIPTTIVIGHQKEVIRSCIEKDSQYTFTFAEQEKQKGTGHALACTKNFWSKEHVLVMNGDMPLASKDLIQELIAKHTQTNAVITFVTAHNADPTLQGYGRIIKKYNNIKIVEAKHFDGDTHEFCCVNAGIYIIKKSFLEQHLNAIKKNTITNEFYITDLIALANQENKTVKTISAPFDNVRGVNTFKELWAAQQIKRAKIIAYWMDKGVRFNFPQTIHIDLDVTIEPGTILECGIYLLGKTTIGKNCIIKSFSTLNNALIENNVIIDSHSLVFDSKVGNNSRVGPFAHIRQNSELDNNTTIGNFVEVKNSHIGQESKAKHLSYLGDAMIGKNVNIGAGTITCNHDGTTKHHTTIKDDTYIGSNNTLIAPLTVGSNAFTAGGSVITDEVPDNALALGRSRQTNKLDYADKIKKQKNEKESSFVCAKKCSYKQNIDKKQ